MVTASDIRLDSARRPGSVTSSQEIEKAKNPKLEQRDRGGEKDQGAGDTGQHRPVKCEPRLDPRVTRNSFRAVEHQRAIKRAEHDDLRDPRQDEHHDDAAEVAQHALIPVLNLYRGGEPERRRAEANASQCQIRASQLRSAASRFVACSGARKRCRDGHTPLLQHDDAEEHVVGENDGLQQRIMGGFRQPKQQADSAIA